MIYNLVTIEGNIGAGKTSLAQKIADDLSGKAILESFADNPFLPRFYENPSYYAFPLELFFMAERYQQLKLNFAERELFSDIMVTDYLFTKSLIFARINLKDEEFKLYQRLFSIINPSLPEPELIIYLYCSIERLIQNIQSRGRDFEQNISKEYLQRIQDMYFEYFRQMSHLKVIVLDVTNHDFINEPKYYEKIKDYLNVEYREGITYLDL